MIIFNLLYIDRFLENSKLYSLYLQAGRKRGPQHWRAPPVIIVKKEDEKTEHLFQPKKAAGKHQLHGRSRQEDRKRRTRQNR